MHSCVELDSCLGCGEDFPVDNLNDRGYCEFCQDPNHEDEE